MNKVAKIGYFEVKLEVKIRKIGLSENSKNAENYRLFVVNAVGE